MNAFQIKTVSIAGFLLLLGTNAVAVASAAAAGDACAVLTSAQISAVLGVTVQAGQHVVPDATSSCEWSVPGAASIGAKKLLLTLMTVRSFESGKTPVRGATRAAAKGIGDEAYYITTPPFGTALSVKKGDAYFQVRISGFPSAQVRTLEKTVAQHLLKRA